MPLTASSRIVKLLTLESIPYATLHRAFLAAFADYAIPFEISLEQFMELHRRRGVRLDLSVGAFDGDDIVGFTFNGLGRWDDHDAGYDAGTGVAPEARGSGLAALMMERSFDLLRAKGATHYLLEVLQSNTTAFRIYQRAGFCVTRELLAWKLDDRRRDNAVDVEIAHEASLDGIRTPDMWDWQPSWQNSLDSMQRAAQTKTILTARNRTQLLGYAIVFSSGDLAQLAVAKEHRRRGIGTALVQSALEACRNPLRIVNTDSGDTGTTAFLEALGAHELVRQYEMLRDI